MQSDADACANIGAYMVNNWPILMNLCQPVLGIRFLKKQCRKCSL